MKKARRALGFMKPSGPDSHSKPGSRILSCALITGVAMKAAGVWFDRPGRSKSAGLTKAEPTETSLATVPCAWRV